MVAGADGASHVDKDTESPAPEMDSAVSEGLYQEDNQSALSIGMDAREILGARFHTQGRFDFAACCLMDAVDNRPPVMFRTDEKSVQAHMAFSRNLWRQSSKLLVWLLLLISLLEFPAVFEVPAMVPFILEVLCLVALFGDWFLKMNSFDLEKQKQQNPIFFYLPVVLVAMFIESFVHFFQGITDPPVLGKHIPKVFRLCRAVVFVAYDRGVRSYLKTLFQMLPSVVDILVLMTIAIVLWTMFCISQFYDCNHSDLEGAFVFNSWGNGLWNLYVLLTTSNFPDVMMRAYYANWANSIIFILYLIVVLYFILSLVLATIYSKYREIMMQSVERDLRFRMQNLGLAFQCIATKSESGNQFGVHLCDWMKVYMIIRPNASKEAASLLFDALDTDHSGVLTFKEFDSVASIFRYKVTQHKVRTVFDDYIPEIYHSKPSKVLKSMVRHPYFDLGIQVVIFFNFVTLLVFTYLGVDSVGEDCRNQEYLLSSLDTFFVVIYLSELVLKNYTFGIRRFWSTRVNQFDALLILLSLCALILTSVADSVASGCDPTVPGSSTATMSNSTHANHSLNRIASLVGVFRVLRVFRVASVLVNHVTRFRIIVHTLFKILPAFKTFGKLLLMCYFVFGTIGIRIWQGKFTPEAFPPNFQAGEYATLEEGGSMYYLNNFDNYYRAFVTLFELMVVNNWMVIVAGYTYVSESHWVRCFFILYHLTVVVFVLNVVQAFVIETFMSAVEAERTGDSLLDSLLQQARQRDGMRDSVIDGYEEPDDEELLGKLRWRVKKVSDRRMTILKKMFRSDLEILKEHGGL